MVSIEELSMEHLRTIVAVAVVTLAMALPRVAAALYNESRPDP